MAVLSVTTTNKRSFFRLCRLKTYLRSIMEEVGLIGLASLIIHRSIKVDINDALNDFFSYPRYVNLLS